MCTLKLRHSQPAGSGVPASTAPSKAAAPTDGADPKTRGGADFFVCWFDTGSRDLEGYLESPAETPGERCVFVGISASAQHELPQIGDKLTLLIQGTRRYTHEAEGCVRWTSRTAPPEPTPGTQRTSGDDGPRSGFEFEVFDPEALQGFLAICRAHRRADQTRSAPPSTANV